MFLSERLQFKTGGGEKAGRQQKRYALAYKLHREGENGPDGFDPILLGTGLATLGLLKGKLLEYQKKDKNNTDYCFVYKKNPTKKTEKAERKKCFAVNMWEYNFSFNMEHFLYTVTKYRLYLSHPDLMHHRMQT